MDNYRFCVRWLLDQRPAPGARVLDYGCGAGRIVKDLRAAHVDACGCDVFYEGGDYSASVGDDLMNTAIRRMKPGGGVPFEDASFDYAIDNQVMEHVEDLGRVLAEIHRVLKPGGRLLSLFPDKGVWREGHCGVPFLHWFPKRTRPRVYYAAAFRSVGFGHHKGDKSVMRWSEDFCRWLDEWTYYRPRKEIWRTFGRYFTDLRGIEPYWLRMRLGRRAALGEWTPAFARQLFVRKFAGLVFVCAKGDSNGGEFESAAT